MSATNDSSQDRSLALVSSADAKTPAPHDAKSHVSSDRPIGTLAADRYGLKLSFIPRLVRVALDWPTEDGLVVGLYGSWGIGKTSVLNMFRDYVHQKPEQYQNVHVASFNPWLYEDTGALVTSFFATIAAELDKDEQEDEKKLWAPFEAVRGLLPKAKGKKDEKKPWKEAARALKAMGTFLTVASKGISLFGFNVDAKLVKDAVDAGTGAFKQVGEFSSGLAGLAELADGGQKKFDTHRSTVEEALRTLGADNGRLVVLIDDVDRMNKTELLSLLRLIRTVADLPYVTLVVAMDDERVRDILSKAVSEGYGQGYLDKIVQVPMHVPLPERDAIKNELVAQIEATLSATGHTLPDSLTPSEYSEPAELRRLVSLVRTPRDLARYLNGVRMLLLAGADPDIHTTDAALIEALRIFYPDVYDRVRSHKHFLTVDWSYEHRAPKDNEQVRSARTAELDALIGGQNAESLGARKEESVRDLLRLLFGDVTDPNAHQTRGAADVAERRIRNFAFFDNYFRYAPRTGMVTRRETEDFFKRVWAFAAEGNTIGIAEILAAEFADRDEAVEDLMLQELEHNIRNASPHVMERLGEGLLKANERLSPNLSVKLLAKLLRVAVTSQFHEDEWSPEKAKALTQKILQTAADSLSVIQLYWLLTHENSLGRENLQKLNAAWILRVDKELRVGDLFEGDAHEGLNVFAHALNLVRQLGDSCPVSLNEFQSEMVKYIVRQPEHLPQALRMAARGTTSRPLVLLTTNRSETEPFDSLKNAFGDYKQLQPAYEAFREKKLDAGPYGRLIEDFGTILALPSRDAP
ncbi:P-loop NTPase fold protein [Archangium sp.]|uniref:KAP family P-loop NTPase fold protein n=1 Tax=Archangium sp. TaxID=1872627 RepID=UPI00286ABD6D|nr:P-loop NTPase fold protein [Archangium sp.]